MSDAAKIIERIRAHRANVILDGGRLHIINRERLPAEAFEYIKRHGKEIAACLDREAEFEERAAIVEFDGGAPREWAEKFAEYCIQHRPDNVSELDWSWFLTQCGKIIDAAPERMAA